MTSDEICKELDELVPTVDALPGICDLMLEGKFNPKEHEEVIKNLRKTGRVLKREGGNTAKLLGVKLIAVAKSLESYDGTSKTRKHLFKDLTKLDKAVESAFNFLLKEVS